MSNYLILYNVKVSADSKTELYQRAEEIGEKISKTLKKKIEPAGYHKLKDSQQKLI